MPRGQYDRRRLHRQPDLAVVAIAHIHDQEPVLAASSAPRKRFRSPNVKTMPYADLREYAAQVGIRAAEIDRLTEERLRQNVAMKVAQTFEMIMGG